MRKSKILKIAAGTIVVGVVVSIILIVRADDAGISKRMADFDNCDHQKLLAVCRQMITDRLSYTSSPSFKEGAQYPNDIILDPKVAALGSEVPEIVRSLRPYYVVIYTNSVTIAGHYFGYQRVARIGVLAWASDAKQSGTRKYIDGLWYWDGTEEPAYPKDK